jgi:hypothetical protein
MKPSKIAALGLGIILITGLLVAAGSSLADAGNSSKTTVDSIQQSPRPTFTQSYNPNDDQPPSQLPESSASNAVEENRNAITSAAPLGEIVKNPSPASIPNYSSCTYGETSKTCCDLVLLRCMENEWRPTLNTESVPPAAGEHLRKILEDPSWDGGGTIFERDFGYCIRSPKFEYCFEKETGLFVRFVWQLDANGNKRLSDRTVLEPDSIPSN